MQHTWTTAPNHHYRNKICIMPTGPPTLTTIQPLSRGTTTTQAWLSSAVDTSFHAGAVAPRRRGRSYPTLQFRQPTPSMKQQIKAPITALHTKQECPVQQAPLKQDRPTLNSTAG